MRVLQVFVLTEKIVLALIIKIPVSAVVVIL